MREGKDGEKEGVLKEGGKGRREGDWRGNENREAESRVIHAVSCKVINHVIQERVGQAEDARTLAANLRMCATLLRTGTLAHHHNDPQEPLRLQQDSEVGRDRPELVLPLHSHDDCEANPPPLTPRLSGYYRETRDNHSR